MNDRIKILIADDHQIVRMGLTTIFAKETDLEVVGEARNGIEAVRFARELNPDIVLMDLLMPKKDGVDATIEILSKLPDTKILLLTSAASSDVIVHALKAGAAGALLKSADFSALVAAIHTVAAGGHVIDPEVQKLLKNDPPLPELTSRQEEILALVTRGLTNADIARQFDIRESSVKEHVNQICSKLGAANRAEAVAIALRKHLLKI